MIRLPVDLNLTIDVTKNNTTTPVPTEKPAVRRYWPVPYPTASVYEYQNVNTDLRLRKDVLEFFHRKVLKWIKTEPAFKHLKTKEKFLQSVDGQMHIYQLLRHFVKVSGINWYDLRDNYELMKKFLSKKI